MTTKNKPVTVSPDQLEAAQRHAAQRIAILQNIATADDLAGTALVEAIKMTALHGATSQKEVAEAWPRCGSPAVYASYFNLGDKVQRIIGLKATLEAIESAAKTGGGAGFTKAREALAEIVRTAKAAGKKELNKTETAKAVKAAVAKATAPKLKIAKEARGQQAQTAAAAKAGQPAGPQALNRAALSAAESPRAMAAFLHLAASHAHKMPVPEGREEAFRKARAALADAAEAWAVFSK